MINNECKKCGLNQEWNEKERKFICQSGYNLIGNECKACEIGEFFNGIACECNLGSYRNGTKCETCHKNCGSCSGPNINQCLTCSDVTYTFKNGTCSKESACPKGLYQKGASCSPCSTYCADCVSDSTCNSCIDGFQLESITYGGVTASYCVEKCGDGKRFELDCDDGNNKNGDGCSADCKIETGWTCTGGSSTKASACILGTPERTYLELTGTVHLYGRIVQGVRLSYIPESLTANDCAECYNLLWVRVIKSDIVPGVRVNYLPKSKYQFLVEFEFHGTFSIPTFNIAVQINPEYAKYFNRKDMAQIQIKTIDPSVLAIKDKEQELSLDDIKTPLKSIKLSNNIVSELFN